jgi:type I restriction enzyme, S subunit
MEGGRKQQMADRSKYKRAALGDIAYNIMRMWQGAVGVAPCDGLISPAYVVARPLTGVNSRFYTYLFRTTAYMREVDFASRGIVPDRNRLYWQYFKPLPSPAPPSDEQRHIANFLDAYTAQVQHLVAAKQRTIAVLLERKQVIIEEALGRSRNGDLSGLVHHSELGQIPRHWTIARLKDWCIVNGQSLSDGTPEDYCFDYFDISVVGTGVLSGQPQSIRFGDAPSRARRVLSPNDVMVSTVRTYLKAVYFFESWPRPAIASTGFAVLTPRKTVVPELLAYALMAPRFIDRVIARSIGVAYPAIAETRLSAIHLALPPSLDEQSFILSSIKSDTRLVDDALAKERAQIDLILEYRDALIAAIVTGRLDARSVEVAVVDRSELIAELPPDGEDMEDLLEEID